MNWARPPVKFFATGADTQAMKLRLSTALAAACLVSAAIPGNGVAAVKVSVPCGGTRGGASGLIAAIKRANAHGGGEINLAQGCTYMLLSGNFDNGQGATALPLVATRIAINGQNSTIARAKGAKEFRLLQVIGSPTAELTVTGLTLKNGNVSTVVGRSGGAILLGSQGSLVVRDSSLLDNAAVNGGAIDAGGAPVKIVDSRLRGNQAVVVDGGGGAVFQVTGPLTIDSSVISGNKSTGGGGGVSGQSVGTPQLMKITDSTISNNSTIENGGGGVFAFGPEKTVITRSTIFNNTFAGVRQAGAGGGIFNAGDMTITDSTIVGNVAGGRDLPNAEAGGIFNASGGTGRITATTIAGNRAVGPGATGGGIVDGSRWILTATILADNQGGNCDPRVRDGGFNLDTGRSCGFTKRAIHANPRLGPLAANGGPTQTMGLLPGSPAINWVGAQRASCRGTIDQRGVPRPQGPQCDIGAVEVVATKTSLRVRAVGGGGRRVRLTAVVRPSVAIPGAPSGLVVFRNGGTVVARRPLRGGKSAVASVVVRLQAGKRRLTASYRGTALFLASASRTLP